MTKGRGCSKFSSSPHGPWPDQAWAKVWGGGLKMNSYGWHATHKRAQKEDIGVRSGKSLKGGRSFGIGEGT